MKIGILTFHRAHNYGAVLQCYALQEILKKMGHEVWVINYQQPFIEKTYSVFRLEQLLRNVYHLKFYSALEYLRDIANRIKRRNNYVSFRNYYLQMTPTCLADNIPSNFDFYVLGSDQIWNSKLTGGVDPVYWGQFHRRKKSKIISYAVSTSLDDFNKVNDEFVFNSLKEVNAISVREKSFRDLLSKRYPSFDLKVCLDPTLVADKDIWNNIISEKYKDKHYVLIYQARPYKHNLSLLHDKAIILAKKYNLDIVDLSSGSYTPQDFVSLFRYATCVITTSFHAVVFSIIFERQLYAITLNDGHDSRYVDILSSLSLEDVIVSPDFMPNLHPIDYSGINGLLDKFKAKSISFLEENCKLCHK